MKKVVLILYAFGIFLQNILFGSTAFSPITHGNTSLAAPGALAHRLQRRIACKIQNGRQWAPNGRRGLDRCLPLGFGAF